MNSVQSTPETNSQKPFVFSADLLNMRGMVRSVSQSTVYDGDGVTVVGVGYGESHLPSTAEAHVIVTDHGKRVL